jgi:hypothetical protein
VLALTGPLGSYILAQICVCYYIESTKSFWTMYFKSCAHSNEVFGIFLSKLQESHPRVAGYDTDEIIHDLANVSFQISLRCWFSPPARDGGPLGRIV